MIVYCDVFECKHYNNGYCTNKFPTGEEAVKMHETWMGTCICTNMDITEEEGEGEGEGR